MLQSINKKKHYLINDNQEWLIIKIITSGFPVPKLVMIFWVDTAPPQPPTPNPQPIPQPLHPHPHPHAVQRESSMWNDIFAMSMCYSISQEICTRFCCALLCCGYAIVHNEFHMKYLFIFIKVALLALGQSLDCHSASEVSLMDMGKSVNV